MTDANDCEALLNDENPSAAASDASPATDLADALLVSSLTQQLQIVSEKDNDDTASLSQPLLLLCDLGYGVPKEARPRKEKILAIARQLVNFLTWQHTAQAAGTTSRGGQSSSVLELAHVVLVDCNDGSVEAALLERMQELWKMEQDADMPFPSNLSFAQDSLDSYYQRLNETNTGDEGSNTNGSLVYLSPDAETVLNTHQAPPKAVVVGMLIDRRIQVDRSLNRSSLLQIPSARWPTLTGLDPKEPFNVDCILEGMQQWQWNYNHHQQQNDSTQHGENKSQHATLLDDSSDCFQRAATQAWQRHQERHPQRPKHKETL